MCGSPFGIPGLAPEPLPVEHTVATFDREFPAKLTSARTRSRNGFVPAHELCDRGPVVFEDPLGSIHSDEKAFARHGFDEVGSGCSTDPLTIVSMRSIASTGR